MAWAPLVGLLAVAALLLAAGMAGVPAPGRGLSPRPRVSACPSPCWTSRAAARGPGRAVVGPRRRRGDRSRAVQPRRRRPPCRPRASARCCCWSRPRDRSRPASSTRRSRWHATGRGRRTGLRHLAAPGRGPALRRRPGPPRRHRERQPRHQRAAAAGRPGPGAAHRRPPGARHTRLTTGSATSAGRRTPPPCPRGRRRSGSTCWPGCRRGCRRQRRCLARVLSWLRPAPTCRWSPSRSGSTRWRTPTRDRGLRLWHKTGTDDGTRADVGLLAGRTARWPTRPSPGWDPAGRTGGWRCSRRCTRSAAACSRRPAGRRTRPEPRAKTAGRGLPGGYVAAPTDPDRRSWRGAQASLGAPPTASRMPRPRACIAASTGMRRSGPAGFHRAMAA